MKAPFIIADIGSNWRRYDDDCNNLECAIRHIHEAATCGVDAVKFQLFTHRELYGFDGDDTYALPREWIAKLAEACTRNAVEFMCTAFSADGVRFVDPFVRRHKIASAEILHQGIRDAILETGKPFLISTGGATDEEAWAIANRLPVNGAILECVAAYPAKAEDYSLTSMRQWRELNRCEVGISDHTLDCTAALVAVGMGATIFEKHFYSDPFICGEGVDTPDRGHSLNCGQLRDYVGAIHAGFSCLGDGIKRPRESEADFVKYAKREAGVNTFRRKKI